MSALRARGPDARQIEIRPATARDIDAVLRLERASFTDPWSRNSFASLLNDSRVYFVVAAAADGRIAGYIGAWFVGTEGEIATLAVEPALRGEGIGGQLLDAAMAAARRRGVSSLYLEVRDSNEVAQALYRSRGFIEVGRRRAYYRNPPEDARVLRVVLGA